MTSALTPSEISLVKTSFSKVAPIAETAAELFYGRLFETTPHVRALFKGDMKRQGRLLMQMLATAVNALDKLETIVPAVQELGRRHVGYGVAAKDYDAVGAALIWTLGQGLGADFTPDTKAAWVKTYGVLSATMIAAAYPN